MKQRKVSKLLHGVALGMCLTPWAASYAAEQEMLWGKIDAYQPLLKNFSLTQPSSTPPGLSLPANLSTQKNTVNTFQFVSGDKDAHKSHVRYNQYYQGIPVWGSELIYHVSSNNTSVTGSLLKGIEQDVKDVEGKISIDKIKQIAIGKNTVPAQINIEKIIYFGKNTSTKAVLAYAVSYATHTHEGPAINSYIIDANTGKIIQSWDALPTADVKAGPTPVRVGQGPGGTDLRDGVTFRYQFGQSMSGMPSFGAFGVTIQNNICVLSNSVFRVINLKNQPIFALGFNLPASSYDEISHGLSPFAYYCSAPNYLNANDNGYAPIHHGISPVNDVNYFVARTLDMLINQYKLPQPIGTNLPLRIYTHVGNFDNAFACGTYCMQQSGIRGPQQLVFGNGEVKFTPLTEGDVVAHEFGHLVTEHFSRLTYVNQSGGMNEAFSDMTGMAMDNYLRTVLGFTWYTEGADWNIGTSVGLPNGVPLRYMSAPKLDGHSIDNAADYYDGLNVHLSSGVYNKAFYLLSKAWTIDKAYQVMLDANMYYWNANVTFNSGACGVKTAAAARGYSTQDVDTAFSQVGVVCSASQDAIMAVAKN